MILSEADAKARWCFQSSAPSFGGGQAISNLGRDGSTRCLGSGCMAWTWTDGTLTLGFCGLAAADAGNANSGIQQTIVVTDGSGLATWTFPTPYPVGIVPVVVATPIYTTQPFPVVALTAANNISVSIETWALYTNLLYAGVSVHIHARAP